jgi:DNA-binding CsgD family transcriptional regulator
LSTLGDRHDPKLPHHSVATPHVAGSELILTQSLVRSNDDYRLLETLQQLLSLATIDLRSTLAQASTVVADALGADKVDVFLYEADKDSLVALGTSDTPMGHQQHALGLDRFPRANAGPINEVFETGQPYHTGHADQDPTQPPGVVDALGVRSQLDVALDVNNQRRGVLSATCKQPDRFGERDLRFLEAVSSWIGLLTHRAELVEEGRREAGRQGRRDASEEVARLTRRQQEVAACVAEGLTNDEIAQRLVVTPGTVANHMEDILRRLQLKNRSSLATWAVEHGLYRSNWDDDE